MRESRFRDERIVAIPKDSKAGMPDLVRRYLEQLEDENRRLRKIVTRQAFDATARNNVLAWGW